MNLELRLASLVLASTSGWVLVVFGSLPVSVLRTHPREPLLAAGLWAIVSATAPPQVFHWYLIFAVFCLVAFTKLHRPVGKVWLALTAALGLTLGIIFPLEVAGPLLLRENPYLLALLYLGGAMTALAYAIGVTSVKQPVDGWRPRNLARGLLIAAALWIALLAARPYLALHLAVMRPVETGLPGSAVVASSAILFGVAFVVLVLALLIAGAVRREAPASARLLAALAGLLALADSLFAQFLS
jgi:hypothetical protein